MKGRELILDVISDCFWFHDEFRLVTISKFFKRTKSKSFIKPREII